MTTVLSRKLRVAGVNLATLIGIFTIAGTLSQSTAIAEPGVSFQIAQSCRRVGRTITPRGPLDAMIPYVISPRQTLLLSDRPTLRWNPVPGVETYRVNLLNGETEVWSKQVTTHEMAYPADVEALKPGVDYKLVVATQAHSSQEDATVTQSFQVLSEAEVKHIHQAETLFAHQPPTDETALMKAYFYRGARLDGEAIATLEARLQQGSQSSAIYRQLGELYGRSSLSLMAEIRLLKAVELAATQSHEQAQIQLALGELYQDIEEPAEAKRWLTQAQQTYRQLDNQLKVQEIQDKLAELTATMT